MICFCTNPLPKVNDESVAFWERIITIPFRYVIPGWQRDSGIEAKLLSGSSGVLNWLLAGYSRSMNTRFALCEAIKDDVAEYRQTIDEYAGFCHACIEDTFDGVVTAKDLYIAYVDYSKQFGSVTKTDTVFGSAMSKKYNKKRTEKGNVYTQIKIRGKQLSLV